MTDNSRAVECERCAAAAIRGSTVVRLQIAIRGVEVRDDGQIIATNRNRRVLAAITHAVQRARCAAAANLRDRTAQKHKSSDDADDSAVIVHLRMPWSRFVCVRA